MNASLFVSYATLYNNIILSIVLKLPVGCMDARNDISK